MLLFYIILFDDCISTYEMFESYDILFLSKALSHLNHMPLKKKTITDNWILYIELFHAIKDITFDSMCESESYSVMSNSLRLHGLYSPSNSSG